MKNYLLTLIFISVITGGLSYLSAGFCYEKQIRYLSMLLTLLALLSPLPSLLSSLNTESPEFSLPGDFDSTYGEHLKNATELRLDEQLAQEIAGQCSLSSDEFSVKTTLDLDEEQSLFSMKEVEIQLHSLSAILKREQIRSIVSTISDRCIFTESLEK